MKPSSFPKMAAALRALDYVRPHMRLGLGTGSTAALFVDALAQRVAEGLQIVGVPTSEATRAQAARLHIPLATLDEMPELDLTIDGADEFDPLLRLIKGGALRTRMPQHTLSPLSQFTTAFSTALQICQARSP